MPTEIKKIPDCLYISITESGENKVISYEYRKKITEVNEVESFTKKFSELTNDQQKIYDAFVKMVDAL